MSELEIQKLKLEKDKLALERRKLDLELYKWIIVAIGAVISFAVVDFGKLQVERFRETSKHERELLSSYLTAIESPKPEIWKRKLHFINSFSKDAKILAWVEDELAFFGNLGSKESLYEEALETAKKLSRPGARDEKQWTRFEELYWSELPFVGESSAMVNAMVRFRKVLISAHAAPENDDKNEWSQVKQALIQLTQTVKNELPNEQSQSTQ
jgi:hypothetical protein